MHLATTQAAGATSSPFGSMFGAKKPDTPAATPGATSTPTPAPNPFGGGAFGAAAKPTEGDASAKEKDKDATNSAPAPPSAGGLFGANFGAKKPEEAAKPAGTC